MAISHPLTTRPNVFAGKIETTTGTPIALAAADGVWNVFDADIKPDIPFNKRMGQGSYGRIKGTPSARAANVTLKTEVQGAGTGDGLKWGDLLTCAGFTVSGTTYTMVSSSPAYNTMTVGKYMDGSRVFSAAGCMFDMKMTGKAGEVVMCEWTGKGAWVVPTTTTMITPTYSTLTAPLLVSATLTIATVQYTLPGFEIQLRNKVALRQDLTAASGYRAAYVTDFDPVLLVSPESLALGTKDWYADYLASSTAALNLVIGGTATNIITITASNLQLEETPDIEEIDGVMHDKLAFQMDSLVITGS